MTFFHAVTAYVFAIALGSALALPMPALLQSKLQRNGKDAQNLNAEFTMLSQSDPCTDGQVSCIKSEYAVCVNGEWILTPCNAPLRCLAMPLLDKIGTTIRCDSVGDALAKLEATGTTGGIDGMSETMLGSSAIVPSVGGAHAIVVQRSLRGRQVTINLVPPTSSTPEATNLAPSTSLEFTSSTASPTPVVSLSAASLSTPPVSPPTPTASPSVSVPTLAGADGSDEESSSFFSAFTDLFTNDGTSPSTTGNGVTTTVTVTDTITVTQSQGITTPAVAAFSIPTLLPAATTIFLTAAPE